MTRFASTLLLVFLLAAAALASSAAPSDRVPVPIDLIDVGDGDTVTIHWPDRDAERIRILGIDTPEVAHPGMGWYDDQPYGREASAFAKGVFAMAESVELLRAGEPDRYGRTLGYVFVNGRNFSVLMIEAGLAVETVNHYGDNGLPGEAAAVLEAAGKVGPVAFDEPYKFRRRMREMKEWREKNGGR